MYLHVRAQKRLSNVTPCMCAQVRTFPEKACMQARHVRVKWVCAFDPELRVCQLCINVCQWCMAVMCVCQMYFSGVHIGYCIRVYKCGWDWWGVGLYAHARACIQNPLSYALPIKRLFRKSLGAWSHYVLFHFTILELIRVTFLASPKPSGQKHTHSISTVFELI